MLDLHRLSELRSLAYHEVIARRLETEPRLLETARHRVNDWLTSGTVAAPYAVAWRELLSRPLPDLIESLLDAGERMTALRQCSPFAGALDPRTRWSLWRRTRAEAERPPA